MMNCLKCKAVLVKNGKSKNGSQRYYCTTCRKYCQSSYRYRACIKSIEDQIVILLKESCGVRSISRILKISAVTVLKKIVSIARSIARPFTIVKGQEYEVDELRTYISNKSRLCWVVYALCKTSKQIIDFRVGKRNTRTLQGVTDTLLLAEAKRIYTDGFSLYQNLIPKHCHGRSAYQINHIERMNLHAFEKTKPQNHLFLQKPYNA